MPRFAILTHDHPFVHWDFLLEQHASCRTWRLLRAPDSAAHVPAESLPDHRLMYLDYEGPVSGNRGHVTRWDSGEFEWRCDQPDKLVVNLNGQRLQGPVILVRSSDGDWQWFHELK